MKHFAKAEELSEIKYEIIYFLLLIGFSYLLVGYRFLFRTDFINEADFLNQSYRKPFVTRVLVVWIAQVIHYSFRISLFTIFTYIDLLSLTLYGWVFSKYINTFINNKNISSILSFSIYLIFPFQMILPRYETGWYPYDIPALLFFLTGLLFIRRNKMLLYYVFFILATINRETSCFLTIIMILVWWKNRPVKIIATHAGVQLCIWLSIKIMLNLIFRNNPGTIFSETLQSNISFLSNIHYIQVLPGSIEVFFKYIFLIGNFAFIYFLILIYWKKLDNQFLRRSVIVIIPFTISMFCVACINEVRILGELIPVVLMPVLYLNVKLLKTSEISIN
jgi:hypothetical protein